MNLMTKGDRVWLAEDYEPPERRFGTVEEVAEDGRFGIRYDDGVLIPYDSADKHFFSLMSPATSRPHRRALFNAVVAPGAAGSKVSPGELTKLIDRALNERVAEVLARVEETRARRVYPTTADPFEAIGWESSIAVIKRELEK
jgi:hypothetical protein